MTSLPQLPFPSLFDLPSALLFRPISEHAVFRVTRLGHKSHRFHCLRDTEIRYDGHCEMIPSLKEATELPDRGEDLHAGGLQKERARGGFGCHPLRVRGFQLKTAGHM